MKQEEEEEESSEEEEEELTPEEQGKHGDAFPNSQKDCAALAIAKVF